MANDKRRRVYGSRKTPGGKPEDIYVLASHYSSYIRTLKLHKLNESTSTVDLIESFDDYSIDVEYYSKSLTPINVIYSYGTDELVLFYSIYYDNSSMTEYHRIIYNPSTGSIYHDMEDDSTFVTCSPICLLPDGSYLCLKRSWSSNENFMVVTKDWRSFTEVNLTGTNLRTKMNSLTNGDMQKSLFDGAICKGEYVYFHSLYSSIYSGLFKVPLSSLTSSSNLANQLELVSYIGCTNYDKLSNLSIRGNYIIVSLQYPEEDRGILVRFDTVNNTSYKTSYYASTYGIWTIGDEVTTLPNVYSFTIDYSTSRYCYFIAGWNSSGVSGTYYEPNAGTLSFADTEGVTLIWDKFYGAGNTTVMSMDMTSVDWTKSGTFPDSILKTYSGMQSASDAGVYGV